MKAVSLQSQSRALLATYAAFLLLALLCAAGIAWLLRSAAGGFGPVSLRGWQNVRWWAFFTAKSAAITASVYLLVWMMVHGLLGWVGRTVYPMADEVAFWTFLPLAVAVLTWSIADQQKRCRVCLRRLSMPVDVGPPGKRAVELRRHGDGLRRRPRDAVRCRVRVELTGARSLADARRELGGALPRRIAYVCHALRWGFGCGCSARIASARCIAFERSATLNGLLRNALCWLRDLAPHSAVFGVSRHKQEAEVGIEVRQLCPQFVAAHAWHHQVSENQIDLPWCS